MSVAIRVSVLNVANMLTIDNSVSASINNDVSYDGNHRGKLTI